MEGEGAGGGGSGGGKGSRGKVWSRGIDMTGTPIGGGEGGIDAIQYNTVS